MIYYVYLLCDPRHNYQPFYVGKGKGDRAKAHLYETENSTENRRKFFKIRKIREAGLTPGIEYHALDLTEEVAYELEASLIKWFGREGIDECGILTNICIDQRPPDPTGRSVSERTKQKIGDAQRGERNHRHGKSWSEEQKQLRSVFNLANSIKPPVRSGPMSEEQKAAIARGNTGKKRTPEQSAHLSAIRKGKKRKPCSEETKEKIRQSNIRIRDQSIPALDLLFKF